MSTIANKITPLHPTHPGEVIKEEIEYRGISQRKLAMQIGVSYSMFNEILNGKRSVNIELALLLEAALGIDPETLINMQSRYNMLTVKQDKTFVERLNEVRKICAVL